MALVGYPGGEDGYGGGDPTPWQPTDPPVRDASPAAPADPWAGLPDSYGTVRGYYQTLLGRDAENPGVVAGWLNGTQGNLQNLYAGIAGSDEAKAYAARSQAPAAPSTPATPSAPSGGNFRDPSYAAQFVSYYANQPGANPSLRNDPNYWIGKITSGELGTDPNYIVSKFMLPEGAPAGGGPSSAGGGYQVAAPGGSYGATNPFDDPATKNYVDLLNSRIQALLTPRQDPSLDAFTKMIGDRSAALQTPYQNPEIQPLLDYMKRYFTQLQQPTYTDAQRATIATQAIDPLERQRQVELRNVAHTMAARGITPGSGPYLAAERDINAKYDQQRAQAQSGFAVNEINQGRQNQAQAAQVGAQIAQLLQSQFANNENRANQGVSLFGSIPQLNLQEFQAQENRANQAVTGAAQIPELARQRMAQAIQLLQGNQVNPAQLLGAQQGFQQQGMNQNTQDSAYWQSVIAALAKAFGL